MGPARYIGRVGALAVALGIGTAVATGHGIAVADTDDDASPTTSESEPAPSPDEAPDSAPEDTDTSGAEEPSEDFDDLDEDLEEILDDDFEPDDPAPVDTDDAPADADGVPVDDEPPAARTTARIVEAAAESERAATTQLPELVDPAGVDEAPDAEKPFTTPEPTLTTAALTTAAVSTTAVNPARALTALPGTFLRVASTLITTVLRPFIGPLPAAPAQAPTLWAVLAWVRREFERTFFNSTPKIGYDATLNHQDPTGEVTGDLNVTDRDGDPVSITIVDGPQAGTVEINADGTFRYIPSAELAASGGTDRFVIRAGDSGPHFHGLLGLFGRGHTTTRTIEVTVAPVNSPPDTWHASIIAYDYTTGAVIGKVVEIDPDGTFTYTPTAEIRHAATSNTGPFTVDSITVVADDGRGGQITIEAPVPILGHNSAPDFSIEVIRTANHTSLITITVNDADGDSVRITVSTPQHGQLTGLPEDGVITVDGAGTVTLHYVPTGDLGSETLTFTFDDGHQGGQATVLVPLPESNLPPAGGEVIDVVTNPGTGVVSGRVVATDPDGDTVTYSGPTTSTLGGTVVLNSDGTFTYTPTSAIRHAAAANTDPVTEDSFTVIADDGHGGQTSVEVTVPILGQNTAPVVNIDIDWSIFTVPFVTVRFIITITVQDPDNDTVRIAVDTELPFEGLPADGVLIANGYRVVTLAYTSQLADFLEPLRFTFDDGHQGGQVTREINLLDALPWILI